MFIAIMSYLSRKLRRKKQHQLKVHISLKILAALIRDRLDQNKKISVLSASINLYLSISIFQYDTSLGTGELARVDGKVDRGKVLVCQTD